MIVGIRLPRHATQTSNPDGSVTMPASARTPCAPRRCRRHRRLLVGHGVHQQVAGQLDAELRQRLGRERHRPEAALHVARRRGRRGSPRVPGVPRVGASSGRAARARRRRCGRSGAGCGRHRRLESARRAGAVPRSRGRAAQAGCPRRPPDAGSQRSTSAPSAPTDLRDSGCNAASSRAGSSGSRAVVSNRIRSPARETSSSARASISARTRCSRPFTSVE